MKKIYLTLTLLFVASFSFASTSDLFKLNYDQVKQDFKQLDQVAIKVKAENLTYDDLMVTDANMINNMALSSVPSVPLPDGALGIPSFLWGCVLGPIGILFAYILTDNDTEEAKKALWGCLAQTAVVIIVDLIIWGSAFAVFGTAY